jgi:hypothetical protein
MVGQLRWTQFGGFDSRSAEAKTLVGRAVEEHMRDRFPHACRIGDCTVIWSHVLGGEWQYCVVQDGDTSRGSKCWNHAESRQDAERRARNHVARLEWTIETGIQQPSYLHNPEDQEEYREYFTGQYNFFRLIAAGMTDSDAHRHGYGDPTYRPRDTDPPRFLPFDPNAMDVYREGYARWNAARLAA